MHEYKSKTNDPTPASRLFRRETKSGYGAGVLGKYYFYDLPKKLPLFLKLQDHLGYTGHSIRRTAATWLANKGFSTLQMQRFRRWKSPSVAQGYVDKNEVALNEFANAIRKPDIPSIDLFTKE